MKERLLDRFPQLVFFTPKVRNKKEIVYAEDLCKGDMAGRFLSNDDETDATEDGSEISDEDVTSKPVHSKSVSL